MVACTGSMSASPRPRAILFDLDDTLISSSGERREVWSETFRPHAHRMPGCAEEDLVKALEAELRWFWSDPVRHREGRLDMARTRGRVLAAVLARFGIDDALLVADLAEDFRVHRERRTYLFDDAHRVLDALRGSGLRLGLITNGEGPVQRAKVERFDLLHRFHHIQIEGEHPFGKPEPAAYAHALETLGAAPGEAWIVGDNLEWEVAVPQRLGFAQSIWFDGHGRGLPRRTEIRPDRVLTRLRDLLDAVGA
jgi:putative hydrolase of the HAD superfamily